MGCLSTRATVGWDSFIARCGQLALPFTRVSPFELGKSCGCFPITVHPEDDGVEFANERIVLHDEQAGVFRFLEWSGEVDSEVLHEGIGPSRHE